MKVLPEDNTRLIVITGGPGAGKTAVLELARKTFRDQTAVLPEAATIVFGGGFWRRQDSRARKSAQRAIFHVQRELERMVLEEGKAQVVLCDRGTLDGLAYWPGDEQSFFRDLGINRAEELRRYFAVIHLRTPGTENGYDQSNPLRIEAPEEAARIDEKILECWKGHPNRHFIDGTVHFLDKAERALALIRQEITLAQNLKAS